MNNIGLIISREYLSRVKKKSFLIMTIVGPLLFAGFVFFSIWTATRTTDIKEICVVDESEMFSDVFSNTEGSSYTYVGLGLDEAKKSLSKGDFDGVLYIPKIDINSPEGVVFYAPNNPSMSLVRSLRRKMRNEVEVVKLKNSGLDQAVLDDLKSNLNIETISLSKKGDETKSNSGAATAIGYVGAFLVYMFIFIYGAMCMRGVVEEKTSRIIEVVISSVKPFNLMLGKVMGIAGVGLTQFLLWVILTVGVISIGGLIMGEDLMSGGTTPSAMSQIDLPQDPAEQEAMEDNPIMKLTSAMSSVNMPLVIVSFLFFFFSGYLLYGALFAAIGSAADSDTDTQQFMFPVIMPLIVSIVSLNAVINDPDGSLAFWMSIIPLTSPVVMMMRVPFGVAPWELILSMVLMIVGFVFTIWLASRIYRIGILMHGTKVNYKTMAKWIMQKN